MNDAARNRAGAAMEPGRQGPRRPGVPDTGLRSFVFIARAAMHSGDFNQRKDVDSDSLQKSRLMATWTTEWRANPQALFICTLNTV